MLTLLRSKTHEKNLRKRFQVFLVLKSTLFKTTLDVTPLLSYFEILRKIYTKMNYLAVLFRLPY